MSVLATCCVAWWQDIFGCGAKTGVDEDKPPYKEEALEAGKAEETGSAADDAAEGAGGGGDKEGDKEGGDGNEAEALSPKEKVEKWQDSSEDPLEDHEDAKKEAGEKGEDAKKEAGEKGDEA